MVRAVHIKYGDGEGEELGERECTLHSTLIALMDREAFKYRNDGTARDGIRI